MAQRLPQLWICPERCALNAPEVIERFRARDIAVACIGECDDSGSVKICDNEGCSATFWNLREQPFIGYGREGPGGGGEL